MTTKEKVDRLISLLNEAVKLCDELYNAYPTVWATRWVQMWVLQAKDAAMSVRQKLIAKGGITNEEERS
jgi:hypothetical protein